MLEQPEAAAQRAARLVIAGVVASSNVTLADAPTQSAPVC
jgi:hypothetical protein